MSIRATVESSMQGTYHEGNIQSAFENQRCGAFLNQS